ncbi:actin-related protein 8 [Selaginella moellendorffii]|nr:actin-related protein 8 [Selaginella moellendorffii]|eukprot:XP_002970341.2 actin-related protein 8 [Selaginella moellendorffii]
MATLLRRFFKSLALSSSASQEESPESAHSLAEFPDDLLGAVLRQLSPEDLATASLVCKSWHASATEDSIWEAILRRETSSWWPFVRFMEAYLRPEFSQRFLAIPVELELPFYKIYCGRRSLQQCLIIDGGSGYCKYGLANKFAPEGKLATFLEFGNIDSPLAPRLSNLYQTILNRMKTKASAQPVVISTPICQNDDTDVALAMRRQYRETTFNVLFDLGFPAVCAVNQAVLALYSAMRTSGIVVNIGFHVTSVVPVYNGTVMRNIGVEVIGQGALRLTGYLSELMHQNGTNFTSMYAIRTLKERLCYVAEDYEAELLKDTSASCDVGDDGNFVLKHERFKTGELLFRPWLGGMRAMGLHHAVALCMEHCADLDSSGEEWYKTIVLTGGSACLPGIKERLAKELRYYLPVSLVEGMTIIPPLHGPHGAWIGAKLLSDMSSFPREWCVSRKKFRKVGSSILHAMAFDDS